MAITPSCRIYNWRLLPIKKCFFFRTNKNEKKEKKTMTTQQKHTSIQEIHVRTMTFFGWTLKWDRLISVCKTAHESLLIAHHYITVITRYISKSVSNKWTLLMAIIEPRVTERTNWYIMIYYDHVVTVYLALLTQ